MAIASERVIVVVDETKLVDRLGGKHPLPVEIVPFGWQTVMDRLTETGVIPTLRRTGDQPFVTDGGHYIADCAFAAIDDAAALERRLGAIVGVVESGLFIGLASTVIAGTSAGLVVLEK